MINRNESEIPQRLISFCKRNELSKLRLHLDSAPRDMFIEAPVDMIRYENDKGLRIVKVTMNLITYCFLHADLEAFAIIRSHVPDNMMGQFSQAIFNAVNHQPIEFSCMRTITAHLEALQNINIKNQPKSTKRTGQLLTCMPPYVLIQMCSGEWGHEIHQTCLSGTRETAGLPTVRLKKNKSIKLTDLLWKPKASKSVSSALIYRGSPPVMGARVAAKKNITIHNGLMNISDDASIIRYRLSAMTKALLISAGETINYAVAIGAAAAGTDNQFARDIANVDSNEFIKEANKHYISEIDHWHALVNRLVQRHRGHHLENQGWSPVPRPAAIPAAVVPRQLTSPPARLIAAPRPSAPPETANTEPLIRINRQTHSASPIHSHTRMFVAPAAQAQARPARLQSAQARPAVTANHVPEYEIPPPPSAESHANHDGSERPSAPPLEALTYRY